MNRAMRLLVIVLLLCITSCQVHNEQSPNEPPPPEEIPKNSTFTNAPELTFDTGTNKGEIEYSWTTAEPPDGVNYTLLVLKGWHDIDEVTANGNSEDSSTDAHSGIFTGDAGEWYSAVVLAKNESDTAYSDLKRTKAKHTGFINAPELTFETGTNKNEIEYSWTAAEPSDEVNYTLLVLKGLHSADEVIVNGNLEVGSTDAYSGTFVGDAGEWYTAVVVVENESDTTYSDIKQAKAKRTEAGEYDLRFGVISDTHIGNNSAYPLHQRFEKALDWYNTEDVTALAIVGDITNNGTQVHWDTFKNSWENHKGHLQLIAVMGNHESDDEDKNAAADRFEAATGQKTNAHYIIDGYHFIVLSAGTGAFIDQGAADGVKASGRTVIPGSQIATGDVFPQSVKDWVRSRIDAAKADTLGMPIFVFLHWPLYNTTYLSNVRYYTTSFGNDSLTGFFKDDPEVVIFGGHAHATNSDPRSIWQGGFTSVNTSAFLTYYMEDGYLGDDVNGVNNSILPMIAGQAAGQGMIVSVKGSKVTIENFDFDFSEGPQPLGNVVKIPQTWKFDVSRPADFSYTQAKRDIQKTTPAFDETELTIKTITATTVEVEFPQAKIPVPNYGNEVVHSYRFDFINQQTGAIDRSAKQWSDFMLTPRLQKPTYTQLVGGLMPNTEYELRIYAYGSFQECSTQYLTCKFTTSN